MSALGATRLPLVTYKGTDALGNSLTLITQDADTGVVSIAADVQIRGTLSATGGLPIDSASLHVDDSLSVGTLAEPGSATIYGPNITHGALTATTVTTDAGANLDTVASVTATNSTTITSQGGRITTLEGTSATHTSQITALQTRATNDEAAITANTSAISTLQSNAGIDETRINTLISQTQNQSATNGTTDFTGTVAAASVVIGGSGADGTITMVTAADGTTVTINAGSKATISTTGDIRARSFLNSGMTNAQMNAIQSPAAGDSVYNTDFGGIFVHNGTSWVQQAPQSAVTSLASTVSTLSDTVSSQGSSIGTLQTAVTSDGTSITALQGKTQYQTASGYATTFQGEMLVTGDVVAGSTSGQWSLENTASQLAVAQDDITELRADLTTDEAAITSLQSAVAGKQNIITTGTTAQYFRGDLSLSTFPPLGGMAALPVLNNKTIYLSLTGNDANSGYTEEDPKLTLASACAAAGSSGNQVAIFPGTYDLGGQTVTINQQNLTITGMNSEKGGIILFTNGTVSFAHTSSSVRCYGISFTAIVNHSGNGNLYLDSVRVNTSLNKSGNGYLEIRHSDTQGSSGTTTTSITGAGSVVVWSSFVGLTTVNNASGVLTISNCLNCAPLTMTLGVLAIGAGTAVYSAASNTAAITASVGMLVLDGCTCLTPSGTPARISVGASTTYSFRHVLFDKANSTISGTRSAQNVVTDAIDVNALTSASSTLGAASCTTLSASGNTTIGGNLTVNGTTITANSTINNYNGYLAITQNPADGSHAALSVTQGGTSSGPIMVVTDSDNNRVFELNQGCDLNLNSKFNVAASSGNTTVGGTLGVTGASTLAGVSCSSLTSSGAISSGAAFSTNTNTNTATAVNLESQALNVTGNTTLNTAQTSGVLTVLNGARFSDQQSLTADCVLDMSGSGTSMIPPVGATVDRPATAVKGMLRYNSTTDTFEGYSGASPAWSALGGSSFSPTLSSPSIYQTLWYDGSVWKNGIPILPPTFTLNATTKTVTVTSTYASSSPFWLNGTASYHYQASTSSGFGSIAFETTTSSTTWSPAFVGGTTYYVRVQQAMVWNGTTFPYSAYAATQSFTPISDYIYAALSTSQAAYVAASANTWVKITNAEWQNLQNTANIPGASSFGTSNTDWSATNQYAGFAVNSQQDRIFSCSYQGSAFTGYPYAVAFQAQQNGVTAADTFQIIAATTNGSVNTNNTCGTGAISASSWTAGQPVYYCLKTPTTQITSGFPVLRCNNNSGSYGHNCAIQGTYGWQGTNYATYNADVSAGYQGIVTCGGPYNATGPVWLCMYTATKNWP